MSLSYLDFDYSEDTEGFGVFDAMASIGPDQLPAVMAEIARVLAWAFEAVPGAKGPLNEGFAWDYDLQGQVEFAANESLVFDQQTGRIQITQHPAGVPRHTVTLSISGDEAFCQALRDRFDLG